MLERRADGVTVTGFTLWEAAFVLVEECERMPPPGLAGWAGLEVLELGAGCGVVGLALAAAGSTVVLFDARQVGDSGGDGLDAAAEPSASRPALRHAGGCGHRLRPAG
jgi:methylase of polypeptide subunit release factors